MEAARAQHVCSLWSQTRRFAPISSNTAMHSRNVTLAANVGPTLRALESFAVASQDLLAARMLLTRVEDTFIVPLQQLPDLLDAVAEHYRLSSADAREGVHYRTHYFDSPELSLLKRSRQDSATTRKIRIRQYPSRGLSFVEIKQKEPHGLTSKLRQERDDLPSDAGQGQLTSRDLRFVEAHLPNVPSPLACHVRAEYRRHSFVSRVAEERLTIDHELRFCLPGSRGASLEDVAIVERKHIGGSEASPARDWLLANGFAPEDFGKYRAGLWLSGKLARPGIASELRWKRTKGDPRSKSP